LAESPVKIGAMKSYGQFCPIAKASEILGERWTHLVIRELGAGSESFNDLRKGLPLMSPSLLSTRLKSLELAGVVKRRETHDGVSYRLTESGKELQPILLQMGVWGQRWIRNDLSRDDLDPSLLMWDIHRTMNSNFFTEKRTVLVFEFTDYTSKMRFWWLVITNGVVDVCLKDPGYDPDLHLVTTVKTLTEVWMGDISLGKALRGKLITITGSPFLKKNISKWLGRNYFSDVKPARRKDPG
jgi:DNA-binding HxlR family transcriptional regulator